MDLRRLVVIGVIAASVLLAVPSAFAGGGSAGQGYGGQGGNTQSQVGAGTAGVNSVSTQGGLPFTGLDLGLLVVGASVLVLVGATLRRAAKRPS